MAEDRPIIERPDPVRAANGVLADVLDDLRAAYLTPVPEEVVSSQLAVILSLAAREEPAELRS